MNSEQQLLAEILDFCARHEMAPTTFGLRACNNGRLVERLQAGSTVEIKTAGRVREFMQAQPGEPIE